MGITDFFSDVWETFSHPSPDAEAPPTGGASTDTPASGTDEQSGEEAEANKEDAAEGGSDEAGHKPSDDDDDEEEEEEEEETVDPKETLEEGRCIFQSFMSSRNLLRKAKQRHMKYQVHSNFQLPSGQWKSLLLKL